MQPRAVRETYETLRALIGDGRAPEGEAAARFAGCLARLAGFWDFSGIVHAGARVGLEAAVEAGAPAPLQAAFVTWTAARLRLVPFEDGWPILRGALDIRPEDPALLRLQALYLWHHVPDQLALMQDAGDVALGPEMGAVWGETLIRLGDREGALRFATGAQEGEDPGEAVRRERAFLAVNAEAAPGDKLARLNARLAEDGLAPLALTDPGRFGLDTLAPGGAAAASPAPSGTTITVVMPARDAAPWLERAAGSILGQTHRALELLIVDDGSRDGTAAVAEGLAARDRRVRVLRREASDGPYIARNEALNAAQGTLVTFLDADDWAHPGRLARAVAAFDADPDLMAHQSAWVRFDGEGRIVLREEGAYAEPCPAGLTIRRAPVLEKAGFFAPHRVGADSEYRYRIRASFGPEAWQDDPAIVTFGRRHGASLTTSGAAPLDCFGWSPTRALYRGSWLDAAVAGRRTGASWAPGSIRRFALPVRYDAEAALRTDAMRRLGGTGRPEDILVLLRGPWREPALSQLARLVAGGWHAGHRLALGVEETSDLARAAPVAALVAETGIAVHERLDRIDAALVVVARDEGGPLLLRVLSPEGMRLDPAPALARVPPSGPCPEEAAYLPDPGLEAAVPLLAGVPAGDMLVAAPAGLGRFWTVGETGIALARLAAPGPGAQGLVILTGTDWTAGQRLDLAHLARALGRRAVAVAPDIATLHAERGLPALAALPAPVPLLPETEFRLEAPGASRVLAELAQAGEPLAPPAAARPAAEQFRALTEWIARAGAEPGRVDLRLMLVAEPAAETPAGDAAAPRAAETEGA